MGDALTVPWALVLTLALAVEPSLQQALEPETRGDDAEALRRVEAYVRSAPTAELARLEAARLRLKLGDNLELAAGHADVARSLAPENPRAHYLHGLALLELGRQAEAIESLEVAVALRPLFATAQAKLGAVLLEAGRSRQALPALEAAASLMPDDAQVRWQWADALERSGQPERAISLLEALARSVPLAREPTLRRLAALLERAGRVKEAAKVRAALEAPKRQLRPLKPSRSHRGG